MTLDSNKDKQPEDANATPDSDTQATEEAAAEAASDAAHSDAVHTEANEAAAEAADTTDDDTTVSEAAAATGEATEADEADEADEHAAGEADEASGNVATISSAATTSKASLPTKAVAAVLMLAFLAAVFLFIQRSSSKSVSYNLSPQDMKVIFQEMIPPQQQAAMASSPEEKQKLIDEVKKLLSVAAFAESEGYAQRPEVQAQLALQSDLGLSEIYRKKYPDVNISDDEINAYYQAHPAEFDTFLQNNPRFQQQATGPNRDTLKKELGKLKVIAERARKEKLDEDATYRVKTLIQRSDVLNNAYLSELDKNADKLVSDADIEKYYSEHPEEFEKVRVRHILISTQAPPPSPDPAKKNEQPKALTKEEARKKAEEVLAKARKGEDFAALAKQYTDDPGSKDKGGEYSFARGEMVPEFEKASFSLQPGQISDLVETQFGYHIIKLEERQGGGGASDPKIRQQIISKLKRDKIDARVNEIAQNSKVVVPQDFDMTVKAPEMPQLPAGHPGVPNDQQ